MARVSRLFGLLVLAIQTILFSFLISNAKVDGQYIQAWTWQVVNGEQRPFWRPTIAEPTREIININPQVVYLEYNCFYLRAICQNARQYIISAINTKRRWRTAFAYDFNTRRGNGGSGVVGRRPSICDGWDVLTSCPERAEPGNLAQPPVMRNHDVNGLATSPPGLWPETQLEFGTREIRGFNDANGNYQRSRLTYSCDEFP